MHCFLVSLGSTLVGVWQVQHVMLHVCNAAMGPWLVCMSGNGGVSTNVPVDIIVLIIRYVCLVVNHSADRGFMHQNVQTLPIEFVSSVYYL